MKKIIILNQFKTDNIGDKLINKVLLENFSKYEILNKGFEKFGDELDVKMYDNKIEKYPFLLRVFNKIGIETLKMKFIDYQIKKEIQLEIKGIDLNNIDLVIIGGGALIENNSRFNAALKKWTEIFKLKNIPIIVLGVSGENVNLHMKKRYEDSLKKCDLIVVRDAYTKKIVSNDYHINTIQYPDIVFLLDIKKYMINDNDRNILNVQVYFKPGDKFGNSISNYFEFFINKIYELNKTHKKIILTYTTHEDKNAAIHFLQYYQTDPVIRQIELIETDTIEQYMKVLAVTKTLISGRMHAMITAMLFQCKIIPLIVNEKINTFTQEYLVNHVNIDDIKKDLNELMSEIKRKYING